MCDSIYKNINMKIKLRNGIKNTNSYYFFVWRTEWKLLYIWYLIKDFFFKLFNKLNGFRLLRDKPHDFIDVGKSNHLKWNNSKWYHWRLRDYTRHIQFINTTRKGENINDKHERSLLVKQDKLISFRHSHLLLILHSK